MGWCSGASTSRRPSETRLAARAFGEPLDLERHNPQLMIKAVTRHMLEVAHEDAGWRVRVVLDI